MELHTKAADDLALVLERERARLFDLVHTDMQTDPLVEDVSTQTEFLVAPVSIIGQHSYAHNFLISVLISKYLLNCAMQRY